MVSVTFSTKKKDLYICPPRNWPLGEELLEQQICFGPNRVGPSGQVGPFELRSKPSPNPIPHRTQQKQARSDHSSRKRGTVGRPSIRIHRPGIRFGNEVRYGMIRWQKHVPEKSVLHPD